LTLDFLHRSPATRVVSRPGAIAELPAELDRLGIRRPLLLSGRRTSQSLVFASAIGALGSRVRQVFTDVPEHSAVEIVRALRDIAAENEIDGFVAVGGGSVSDTAKATALWLSEGGELEDHASRFTPPAMLHIPELKAPKLPIVAIPTTASGAECGPGLGVRTPDGRKLLFSDLQLACRTILIDPQANLGVPARLMLSTGMNGLAHCIEGLYAKTRTPITDALCLHGVTLFADALPRVAREPASLEARSALLAAAHLSGLIMLNARTCAHHAICHAIGAITGAGHGEANAVMLPHAMAFNRDFLRAGQLELVRELQKQTGVPTRLRDIGVPHDVLAKIATKTMGERGLYFNPRQVRDASEIQRLLEEAW
jgi:alcohol dehydrogenase class IV